MKTELIMKSLSQIFPVTSMTKHSLDKTDRKIIEATLLESFKEVVHQEYEKGNVFLIVKLFAKNKSLEKKSLYNKIIYRTMIRLRNHLQKPSLLLRKACKVILKKLIRVIQSLNKTSSTTRLIDFVKSLRYNKVNYQYSYSSHPSSISIIS